jgi:signal transduction histidine kinase
MRSSADRGTVTRMRRLPVPMLDALLALACAGWALLELIGDHAWTEGPRAIEVVGALAAGGSVALRRRAPLAAVSIYAGALLLMVLAGQPPELLGVVIAGIIIAYSLAAELDGNRLVAGLAILAGAVAVKDTDDPKLSTSSIVIELLFYGMGAAAGRVVRRRERKVEHVARVADERADDAVRHERRRIARELHDVIAHSMSVIVVQADSARLGLAPDDDETRSALTAIEESGRESLREMRRLLGLLRDDDAEADEAVLGPQAGMKSLEALVRTVRQAGLPVELQIDGEPQPLAPGIDLAAYRIVQEALTNTLRHAGPARAKVSVHYDTNEIRMRIEDNGRGNGTGSDTHGNGLVGMRERARLYGGSFDAGPAATGFVVSASLPLETPR